jgi:hypothetical protein
MKNARLWTILSVTAVLIVGSIEYFSRGPDFQVLWSRQIPSLLKKEELAVALGDTKNWPVFHHELKETKLFRMNAGSEVPVTETNHLETGMHVTFKMEPVAKEWKRYEIRAEITSVEPGKSVAFRLLPESRGKITKVLGDYEWSFSVIDPDEKMKARGYQSAAAGEAHAQTLTGRARFFGRIAAKILMNQTYPVDLARLANYEENKEARAGDYAPVYK